MDDLPSWLNQRLVSGEKTDLKQTHISWVLLVGEDAYKIKKPVNFGFVDFSSLARRRHFCFEELRLNRRLAPELYLGVYGVLTSLTDRGQSELILIEDESAPDPELDDYELVDYAIHMRRFGDDALLTEAMSGGGITKQHITALADQVADFHEKIEVASPDSGFAEPRRLIEPAKANFTFLKYLGQLSEYGDRIQQLKDWSDTEADRLNNVMLTRRDSGKVRECHGDMHLGNMILNERGEIEVFDGIEFNDAFRWIDVASEVAFFVMDCMDRGHHDLACTFLNRYLEKTGDYQLLGVLTFYMVYRALVRAKVAFLRLTQTIGTKLEGDLSQPLFEGFKKHRELKAEIDRYMNLACQLVEPRPRCLLINFGLSGSGKSHYTELLVSQGLWQTEEVKQGRDKEEAGLVDLAGLPWLVRIRSDVERKRMAILKPEAGGLYSNEMSHRVYQYLYEQARFMIASGFSPVIDATFLSRNRRDEAREVASQLKIPFGILFFEADESLLNQRLKKRRLDPMDPSDADEKVMRSQRDKMDPIADDELEEVVTITQSATDVDEAKILDQLAAFVGTLAGRNAKV